MVGIQFGQPVWETGAWLSRPWVLNPLST
jgi:hypothetical protein